jgi:peptidoglycan/LPS O-acetylase OafA/YrhL
MGCQEYAPVSCKRQWWRINERHLRWRGVKTGWARPLLTAARSNAVLSTFGIRDRLRLAGTTTTTFRPDIEGLRAVAVALVALDHAGVKRLAGGYVGVDVFFVLSGFLITSLLLREVQVEGRPPSIRAFYARRVRRILPAATLVIIVTLISAYATLGFIRGGQVAIDARWASAFAANIHFALTGTDYLGSQDLPSPLQHYWSLGVEEQFYIVWPLAFVLLASRWHGTRLRSWLALALAAIFVGSLAWSAVQTQSNGVWAYYSPLTRAWELAVGALVAVGLPMFKRVPAPVAALLTWLGVAGILASAVLFDSGTPFPGTAALLPVLSTALVVANGSVPHRANAQLVLGLRPMQWLGGLSFAFYLWHWPLLVIPAEAQGERLSLATNLGLLGIALILSVISYSTIEHPIRTSRYLMARPVASLACGTILVVGSILFATWALARHGIV